MAAGRDRSRLLVAAGVALLGALVTVAIISQSSGSTESAAPPPTECLADWNGDRDARSFARHNRTFHGYAGARVALIEGTTVSETGDGDCVVVFPRDALDPEPEYAGQVLRDGRWQPLTEVLDATAVDGLQSEALSRANVTLARDGRLLAS